MTARLFLLLLLFPGLVSAQEVRFNLASQISPSRTRHLLLDLTGPPGQTANKIVVKLPKGIEGTQVVAGNLPKGWKFSSKRTKFTLTGPEMPLPLRARLEIGRADAPLQVKVAIYGGGERIFKRDNLILQLLPPLIVRDSLRGILALPPRLMPGDLVEMCIINPRLTPSEGTWTIAGVPLKAALDSRSNNPNQQNWMLSMTVPELAVGAAVSVVYQDALGLRTVFVPENPQCVVVAPNTQKPTRPVLAECAPRAVISGALCVGGWFPSQKSRLGLLIDGKPAPVPVAVCNQAIFMPLLPGLKPGKHTVSGDPAAGFSADMSFEFEAIDVQAEIDKGELVAGQMAELSFFVLGSSAPMKIRVINTTPEVISMDGGDVQVIETFGGGGNISTRTIETKALGNFVIQYELAEDHCPCLEK